MSFQKFGASMPEFPEERRLVFRQLLDRFPHEVLAIEKLASLVGSSKDRLMTFEHLVAKLEPESVPDLALILSLLERSGLLRQFVQVESPSSKGAIEKFPSLHDVPHHIYDWRTDQDIEVTPDRLRTVYQLG